MLVQDLQRVAKPCFAPVEDMVVGQRAAIDFGHVEDAHVGRIHSIVQPMRPWLAATGQRGFQVDQADMWPSLRKRRQGNAPGIGVIDRSGDLAVFPFGKAHVIAGVLCISLMDGWVAALR